MPESFDWRDTAAMNVTWICDCGVIHQVDAWREYEAWCPCGRHYAVRAQLWLDFTVPAAARRARVRTRRVSAVRCGARAIAGNRVGGR